MAATASGSEKQFPGSPRRRPRAADGRRPALLFDGGLLAGAALALAFGWWLRADAQTPLQSPGAAAFALSALAMGGVGAFPSGHPLHVPAAAGALVLAAGAVRTARDGLGRDR